MRMELKHFLRLNDDESKSFLQSMMVTVVTIQEKLTQLIEGGSTWVLIEGRKENENHQENVSAVFNRWIHRQG